MFAKRRNVKLSKLYPFIGETYREIRKHLSTINNDMNSQILIAIINKYRKGCNEIINDVLEYSDVSRMLSGNIVRTLDLLKAMSTNYYDLEEFQHRVCELVAIFISCELRVSMDCNEDDDNHIGNSIVYIMRRHLIQCDDEQATLYNILRTLVYIPRFSNARQIMCAIFEELITLKPPAEVKPLTDKLYMLYIIVFYRWLKMQPDIAGQELIIKFAESFMKPKVSLCTNTLYCQHLPRYTRHSEATRTILRDMQFYKNLRNACIIDNAFKVSNTIVNLCDDDDDDNDDDVIVVESTASADVMNFAQLFAAAELEPAKPYFSNVKREKNIIVDTVDLTAEENEDEDETILRSVRERHGQWLEKLELVNQQCRKLQQHKTKQLQQQPSNVICLDSDPEDQEEVQSSKTQSGRKSSESTNPVNETEDLFDDNYPLTVTPIDDANVDLQTSDIEDRDDGTKLAPRFLRQQTPPLRTYQVKKSSSCSVSSADDNGYHSPNQLLGAATISRRSSICQGNMKSIAPKKLIYRRNSLHIHATPPNQHSDESSDDSQQQYSNLFHSTSPQRSMKSSAGPGVPFDRLNTTLAEGNVVFSQAMPSRNFFHSNEEHDDDDAEEERTHKKSEQSKSKRVHFDNSPLGPTSAYSKQKALHKSSLANQQNSNCSTDVANYFHPCSGGSSPFRCTPPSLSGGSTLSLNTTCSMGQKQQQEQKEHRAAATTLFRNIFDRPRLQSTCGAPTSGYPSMFSPNASAIAHKHPSPAHSINMRLEEPTIHVKKSALDFNRLKQRRSTICGRSDFNGYTANNQDQAKRKQRKLPDQGEPYEHVVWNGLSLRDQISDHLDVASNADSNVTQTPSCRDEKLSKRCAVLIKPTEELLEYERQRDLMYNEILQRQRRKLELRTMEKMKEKERRRQQKQHKREEFQREQSETVKQLERMNLSSKSDEEETRMTMNKLLQSKGVVDDSTAAGIELNPLNSANQQELNIESQVELNSPTPGNPLRSPHRGESAKILNLPNGLTKEKSNNNGHQQQQNRVDAMRLAGEKRSQQSEAADNSMDLEFLGHPPVKRLTLSPNIAKPKAAVESTSLREDAKLLKEENSEKIMTTLNKPKIRKSPNTKNDLVPKKLATNKTTKQDDKDSSELDHLPLIQRKTRVRRTTQQKPPPKEAKETIISPSNRPVRECRLTPTPKPNSLCKKRRRSSLHASGSFGSLQDVEQTTDSELETRRPARITRERRKSLYVQNFNKNREFEFTTSESEIETEQRRPVSATLRHSPRFNKERGHNLAPDQSPSRQSDTENTSPRFNKEQDHHLAPGQSPLRQTDMEKPSLQFNKEQDHHLAPVQSPLRQNDMDKSSLQINKEQDHLLAPSQSPLRQSDSENETHSTNMCATRKLKLTIGRNKQNNTLEVKKPDTKVDKTSQSSAANKSDNPEKGEVTQLSEQSIVEVIAQSLSSPDYTMASSSPLAKEIQSSEHEEILETLDDFLNKENSCLGKQHIYEGIASAGGLTESILPSNEANNSQRTSNSEDEEEEIVDDDGDDDDEDDMHSVIENIVLNEIQREMDVQISHARVSRGPNFECDTKNVEHLKPLKRAIINFEDEVLPELLQRPSPLPQEEGMVNQTGLPILISNVQSITGGTIETSHSSIGNHSESNNLENESDECRQTQVVNNPTDTTSIMTTSLLNVMDESLMPADIDELALPNLTLNEAPNLPDMPLLDMDLENITKADTNDLVSKISGSNGCDNDSLETDLGIANEKLAVENRNATVLKGNAGISNVSKTADEKLTAKNLTELMPKESEHFSTAKVYNDSSEATQNSVRGEDLNSSSLKEVNNSLETSRDIAKNSSIFKQGTADTREVSKICLDSKVEKANHQEIHKIPLYYSANKDLNSFTKGIETATKEIVKKPLESNQEAADTNQFFESKQDTRKNYKQSSNAKQENTDAREIPKQSSESNKLPRVICKQSSKVNQENKDTREISKLSSESNQNAREICKKSSESKQKNQDHREISKLLSSESNQNPREICKKSSESKQKSQDHREISKLLSLESIQNPREICKQSLESNQECLEAQGNSITTVNEANKGIVSASKDSQEVEICKQSSESNQHLRIISKQTSEPNQEKNTDTTEISKQSPHANQKIPEAQGNPKATVTNPNKETVSASKGSQEIADDEENVSKVSQEVDIEENVTNDSRSEDYDQKEAHENEACPMEKTRNQDLIEANHSPRSASKNLSITNEDHSSSSLSFSTTSTLRTKPSLKMPIVMKECHVVLKRLDLTKYLKKRKSHNFITEQRKKDEEVKDNEEITEDEARSTTGRPINELPNRSSISSPAFQKLGESEKSVKSSNSTKQHTTISPWPKLQTSEEDAEKFTRWSPTEIVIEPMEDAEDGKSWAIKSLEEDDRSTSWSPTEMVESNGPTEDWSLTGETANSMKANLSKDKKFPINFRAGTPTKDTKRNSGKKVTFNLIPEIIEINSYSSSSISLGDRALTPPPRCNDSDYDDEEEDEEEAEFHGEEMTCKTNQNQSMITPAIGKKFNDESLIAYHPSTSHYSEAGDHPSTDSEAEDRRQEVLKNFTAVIKFNQDFESSQHEYVDKIPEHDGDSSTAISQKITQISSAGKDYMTMEASNELVPVYLFSEEIVDLMPMDTLQVSSSYIVTNGNSQEVNKAMMSPSEQEVSSTQETLCQTPKKLQQNEANALKQLSGSKSPTGVLQNNQVDTTNTLGTDTAPTLDDFIKASTTSITSTSPALESSSSTLETKDKRKARRMSIYEDNVNKSDNKDKTKTIKETKKTSEESTKPAAAKEGNNNVKEKKVLKKSAIDKTTSMAVEEKTSGKQQHSASKVSKKPLNEGCGKAKQKVVKKTVITEEDGKAVAVKDTQSHTPTTTTVSIENAVKDKPKEIKFRIPKIKKGVLETNEETLTRQQNTTTPTAITNRIAGARNPFVTRNKKTNFENIKEAPNPKNLNTQESRPENSLNHKQQIAGKRFQNQKIDETQAATTTTKTKQQNRQQQQQQMAVIAEAKQQNHNIHKNRNEQNPAAQQKKTTEQVLKADINQKRSAVNSQSKNEDGDSVASNSANTRREHFSISSGSHTSDSNKKPRRNLHEDIAVEIYTMAADVTIPKPNLEEFSNSKRKYRFNSNKEDTRLGKTSRQSSEEVVAVNLIKVSDLREPSTTGIKSAVGYGIRRYSWTPTKTMQNVTNPAGGSCAYNNETATTTTTTSGEQSTTLSSSPPIAVASASDYAAAITNALNHARKKPRTK